MPDTDRYREWVRLLAASDAVLVQLVALAVAAVLVWELLRRLREPWRARLRRLYVVVAVGTMLTALRGTVSTPTLAVLAALLSVSAMSARALVDRRRRLAGEKGA